MEEERNIKEMSEIELKATAYDILAEIQRVQIQMQPLHQQLNIINDELVKRKQPPVDQSVPRQLEVPSVE